MKKNNAFRAVVLLFPLLLLPALNVSADQLGHSGGIENDGETPVKVQFFYDGGEYEWQELARDSFQPFPEKIRSVRVLRAENPYYDGGTLAREFKVIVTHRDGKQQVVRRENEVISIEPDWGVKDSQKTPMFVIENRP